MAGKPKRSWKTTTCGAIAVVATAVIGADFGPLATKIASCAAAAAGGLGLLFARDANVSSASMGIEPKGKDNLNEPSEN